MKVRVDRDRCQGHGRCYTAAPELFAADDLGNSQEIGAGVVPEMLHHLAELAVANCPEHAVLIEGQAHGSA